MNPFASYFSVHHGLGTYTHLSFKQVSQTVTVLHVPFERTARIRVCQSGCSRSDLVDYPHLQHRGCTAAGVHLSLAWLPFAQC